MPTPALDSAVILAAGRGTRIWPYGTTKPKAALPVLNRPNIAWQVEALRTLGIKHIVVVVGHLGSAVRHALRHDADITFIEQPQATGNADAASLGMAALNTEICLVLYGDIVTTPASIEALLAGYAESPDDSCALLVPLRRERPQDWICASVSGDNVAEIVGHPRGDVTDRLGGAFVLTKPVMPYLDAHPEFMTNVQVGTMPPQDRDLAMSLQAAIADGVAVRAVVSNEPFTDLDKPWHILEASHLMLDWTAGTSQKDVIPSSSMVHSDADVRGTLVLGENVFIGPRVVIQGNAWIGSGTIVDNGAILGPNVMIGANCEVRDYCKLEAYTVIGDGCHIGHAAEVSGVFFDNVWAVHYMEVWGVVGSSSDLGAATVYGTLRFDDGPASHRINGRREDASHFANASYLGDYVRTGVNAVLMPGTKVGCYSLLGPGTIVTGDIPERTMVRVEQSHQTIEWGPERYGW